MLKLLSIVENTTLGLVRNFDILQDYIYIHTHTHTHIYFNFSVSSYVLWTPNKMHGYEIHSVLLPLPVCTFARVVKIL